MTDERDNDSGSGEDNNAHSVGGNAPSDDLDSDGVTPSDSNSNVQGGVGDTDGDSETRPVGRPPRGDDPNPPKNIRFFDGRRNHDRLRRYEVQELQDKHREVIRLSLRGHNNKTIATILDCGAQNISDILNSTIVRKHIEELQLRRDTAAVTVQDELADLSEMAVDCMREILNDEVEASPALKMKVADSVLDRAGHGKQTSVNFHGTSLQLTLKDIDAVKERAAALAVHKGMIVDTTAEVVGVSDEGE